ncbi:MFS transporter [Pelagibaculum spongiae]|uniref:MFS transporter n=1 Tax=Pelagibaculum spongiae TaxID=2080658 RepID=A0A2V1GWK9_9GAMM|nr:MFS transporter [Pelagibaculum spongiae]PVZ63539.1 MFS transporter [Pelagibaculum spongiae]
MTGSLLESPLQNPSWRKMFSAQILSLAGTGITTIALALLAWDIAGDKAGLVLGTALALKMVAYVLLAPIIGAFADRLPRKKWLISLDIIRALIVLSLPWVTEIWQIWSLIFLLNVCSAGFTPVFQATIPDLLTDPQQYQQALAHSRLAYDLEQILSPSAAALLLLFIPFDGLFVIDSISFIISALLVTGCLLPKQQRSQRPSGIFYNIRFGLAGYLKTPRLKALWAMYFAVACASSMVIVNTVVYVRDLLGGDESLAALAIGFCGLGSMLIAFILPRFLQNKSPRSFMLAGCVLLTIALLFATTTPSWTGFAIVWFVLGVGLSLIQTPAATLVRRSCHSSDATAYFAANFSLSHLCWLAAYLLAGWLGSYAGLSITFAVMGAIALLATFTAIHLYPKPDPIEIEHEHPVQQHSHCHDHHSDDQHHAHLHQPIDQDGQPDHSHQHTHDHPPLKHSHPYVIDAHHPNWPE